MSIKLTIAVAGLSRRPWQRAVMPLQQQATDEVEVIANIDNGTQTSGQKRQNLLDVARGEYIAYVDDDDAVAGHYVKSLLAEIEHSPDVVTFDIEQRRDDEKRRHIFRTDVKDGQKVDVNTIYMVANHLCAWKTEIARTVSFPLDVGYGDDQLWYKPLMATLGSVQERHIDDTLYWYIYNSQDTVNQQDDSKNYTKERYKNGVEVYTTPQEGVLVATHGILPKTQLVEVRDCRNYRSVRRKKDMKHVETIKVR